MEKIRGYEEIFSGTMVPYNDEGTVKLKCSTCESMVEGDFSDGIYYYTCCQNQSFSFGVNFLNEMLLVE